jgi:hypothetical protein
MENIAATILDETSDLEGVKHLVDIPGLSSPRVCHLLNRLVAGMAPGERYLEIGTYKGRTLLSAAHNNKGKICYACDKFRLWGKHTGFGFEVRHTLKRNVERYKATSAEIRFFDMTSRALFDGRHVQGPIGVYFYDGDHTARGTHHGVVAAAPLLAHRSILVMDDWNDPIIQKATYAGIVDASLDIVWERHLKGDHSERGWWNGIGVFYLEKR